MKNQTLKWILVVGARPNFMKIAPMMRAIEAHNDKSSTKICPFLVHTGQHYDVNMSDSFFKDLNLPEPDVHLGVGSGTHAEQTGRVMIEFEKVLFNERPDLVIVVGDVNSTLAAALAAVKLCIPVAHVEAGLRSFDRSMPEEINRLLADAISDYLFTPSADANENLKREGIPEDKIFLVGDVMVDSLQFHLEQAKKSKILEKLGLRGKSESSIPDPCSAEHTSPGHNPCPVKRLPREMRSLFHWGEACFTGAQSKMRDPKSAIQNPQSIQSYALLTLHRPSNVDDKDAFLRIINALTEISKRIPVIFPVHPRTRNQIEAFRFQHYFVNFTNIESPVTNNRIYLMDPLGYLDFLNLMAQAKMVLTDSGGIQEETTVLKVPCITLRNTTERPITLSQGTNVLVWNDTHRIKNEAFKVLDGKAKRASCPNLWDGRASERIVSILGQYFKT